MDREGKGSLQTAPFTVPDNPKSIPEEKSIPEKSIGKSPTAKIPDMRWFRREVPLFEGVGTDI
jgi:hypothetical protein